MIPHQAVLVDEVIATFAPLSKEEGYIIDSTLGFATHTYALLKALPHIHIIGIDQDQEALRFSKERLTPFKDRVECVQRNFSQIAEFLQKYPVKGVLADIGISSYQLDTLDRGFGFESDRLDMRMDQTRGITAYEVVNHYTKERLEQVLRDYGEVRLFKAVAQYICKERQKAPIHSAKALSDLIASRFRPFKKNLHPATLVFQAIRIEVNRELMVLEELLNAIEACYLPRLRVAIISFHSLEDRVVKQRFKRWASRCICDKDIMRCICGSNHQKGSIITKKPITPTALELQSNRRSRSSKMRLFEFF